MRIDIHTHTLQCKSGDPPTRSIAPADFCERVLATDVGIIAITNHNLFDLGQFRAIEAGLGQNAQAWPGVELDIIDDGVRGHLIVIVSPTAADAFSTALEGLVAGASPDSFTTSIALVLSTYEPLGPLYIAHYRQKKPNLTEGALQELLAGTKHPQRVIREVTNSISAGIYISHGHPSIYGSDVQDWAEYESIARSLPELRLPVDSFEHFCLLLDKDPTTINTALHQKTSEELLLQPFEDESFLKLTVFNDINVVFGAKGTGKSCILKAIARHYAKNGVSARVYEPGSDRLHEIFDTKGKDLTINLVPYDIHYCSDEIEALRAAKEATVTALSKYVNYFASKTTNRNAKRLLIRELNPEQEGTFQRLLDETIEAIQQTRSYLDFVESSDAIASAMTPEGRAELTQILTKLITQLSERAWEQYCSRTEVQLLNSAISLFRTEVERKTGSPAKPTTTGFRGYAKNRISIEVNA